MATELAKAYVQIVPSTKGIGSQLEQQLGGEMPGAGEKAGNSLASSLKKAFISAGVGAAIAKTIKEAFDEGAALQQSIGGVETLFKDSADLVRQYADEAYKTAGVSANSYMEQVTSFSAALLQSLGGDTKAAAETANMAIIDMSDNANKFGTDIQSIQNAYQGFAKQNYMMLDNLKLGYGGTKQEMERLLEDAEKLSGVHYDISSLDDVYNAIHVIQTELGVAGTTAEEAATTFTGSFAAMKAAVQNVLGELMLGEDITPALEGLVETTRTFLVENALPMLQNLVNGIVNNLPVIVEAGLDVVLALVDGIVENLDQLIPAIVSAVLKIVEVLTEPENLERLLAAAAQIILAICKGIIESLPLILQSAMQIVFNILTAIGECFAALYEKGREIVQAIANGIADAIKSAIQWGRDLIDNFVQGIRERVQRVIDEIKDLGEKIRNFLGFSEPEEGPLSNFHTFAPDMMELFAKGIRDNANLVTDEIGNAFDVGPQIIGYARASNTAAQAAEPARTQNNAGAPVTLPPINVTLVCDGYTLGKVTAPAVNSQNYGRGDIL